MKVKDWLKQFEHYSEEMLDKEILIECPNGLLVTPTIKKKYSTPFSWAWKDMKAFVVTSQE